MAKMVRPELDFEAIDRSNERRCHYASIGDDSVERLAEANSLSAQARTLRKDARSSMINCRLPPPCNAASRTDAVASAAFARFLTAPMTLVP